MGEQQPNLLFARAPGALRRNPVGDVVNCMDEARSATAVDPLRGHEADFAAAGTRAGPGFKIAYLAVAFELRCHPGPLTFVGPQPEIDGGPAHHLVAGPLEEHFEAGIDV